MLVLSCQSNVPPVFAFLVDVVACTNSDVGEATRLDVVCEEGCTPTRSVEFGCAAAGCCV